jgi:hypothetical protein
MNVSFVAGLTCCGLAWLAQAQPAPLELKQTIALTGVEGRFDHFDLDLKGQRLFVAALGNNTLEVIDLVVGKRVRSLTGLRKPQGVLCVPDLDRLYVACGEEGTCRIFELSTLKPLKSIGSLPDADNVRYDQRPGLISVGYGDGALALIDVKKEEKIGEIKLPGHPESFQIEQNAKRIFVNVPDAKLIRVIDRKVNREESWPMEKFQANFPMALDAWGHRLFIGCRQPPRLIVLATDNGYPIADYSISGDTDDLFFDVERKRIYIIGGEGFVDVIEQISPDDYRLLGKSSTAPGARTGLFSAGLQTLFVAIPHRGNQAAEIRVFKCE